MAADGQKDGQPPDVGKGPPLSSAALQEQCKTLALEAKKILDDAVTLRLKIQSHPQNKPELREGATHMAALREQMEKLKGKVHQLVPEDWLKEDKCANHHKLKPFVTTLPSDSKYRRVLCDICTVEQKPGSRMRGCRPCNYDVCAGCKAETPITTVVWEPWRRGMSCGQFEKFFNDYCGTILYPQSDEGKAVAVVTKLAARCFEENQKDALAKKDVAFPYLPNLYAVNQFFIKEHTKGERCHNKHLLSDKMFTVPDDGKPIHCSDCNEVQPNGSLVKRCTQECKYHVCVDCREKAERCPNKHTLKPTTVPADQPTAEAPRCTVCNEDVDVGRDMHICSECKYAICGDCVRRTAKCDSSHELVADDEEYQKAVRCSICEQDVKKCSRKCPEKCDYYMCGTCKPKQRLVSYAEHLNPEGKRIDFFISHHWGEDFGEFIQSLIRHAVLLKQVWADKQQLRKDWRDFVYWCCAFANNQHLVKLGEHLESSPFCKALKFQGCLATIMNLNQMVTALFRIWCSYEVMLTHKEKKPFMVCTRNGPLIPDNTAQADLKDAWVVHMNEVLSDFNVENAESTAPKDQRDIMAAIETFTPDDCGGKTGVPAFNMTVKSMLAGQALYTLARNGDHKAVKVALEAKADPMKQDSQGIPAITYAVGKLQALKALLDKDETAVEGGRKRVEDYEKTVEELSKAIPEDSFTEELAEEVLDMWDPIIERRIEAFKKYRARQTKSPQAKEVVQYKDAYRLAMERHKGVCKEVFEKQTQEDRANLCYAPTKYHLRLVEEHIKKLQEAVDYEGLVKILTEALEQEDAKKKEEIVGSGKTGDMLMVVLTDLEPDDVMATAQMWQLWKEELAGPPLVCFLANFADEDKGRTFPQKLLLSSLMLGLPDIVVLPAQPDDKDPKSKLDYSQTHPAAKNLVEAHAKTIGEVCDTLVAFGGSTISLKLLAPARGHLAAIVDELKRRGAWEAVKKKIVVAMYSGRFNVQSSTEQDFEALKEIIMASRDPLIDVAKYHFFGGDDFHPMTASFTTFAPHSFAGKLNKHAPLLAAVLKTFNDEFNGKLIKPQPKLFGPKCKVDLDVKTKLGEKAYERWKKIEPLYVPGDYNAMWSYAKELHKDKELMKSVAGYKRSTIVAYALEGCDSPLCDQLLFLHAWLKKEEAAGQGHCLVETEGSWELDTKNGWTKVRHQQGAEQDNLRAIQPAVADPFDVRVLTRMQNALEEYLCEHLKRVYGS